MLSSRTRRLSLLTLIAAALAAASLAPAASAATQRYASPNGSGTDCNAAEPCGITEAVEGAGVGDEVIVAPGDYPVTQALYPPAQVTLHGVAGQPRPRLLFNSQAHELYLQHDATLRYVEVHQASWGHALSAHSSSTVDQVILTGAGPGWQTAVINNSAIRNSIVVSSGTNGIALLTRNYSWSIPNSSSYRNVTAVATGSGGVAIEADASVKAKATIHAANVIARGGPGGYSFTARTDSSLGAQATITVTHSSLGSTTAVGTSAAVVNGGSNQGSSPAFVNAAAGDYRQAAGSPTIGAGLNDTTNGSLDVDGHPRQIGMTDIGADEFVYAPAATTGAAGALGDRSAALSGSVDPKGAPTSYHFEYGPTTAYGATTAATGAGSGTAAIAAAAMLGGLSPATTYHYRIVATNAGGVTTGTDQTLTTAPTLTPPPPPPPRAGFTGVKLVSTKLSVAGRFVTLKLRCPAATVGSCSGKTKLSARRGRVGSRPAVTVALGRAGFSIAPGRQAKLRLRVSRPGRRLLARTPRLRGKATSAARDAAGQSKTTAAKVTIRRRQR